MSDKAAKAVFVDPSGRRGKVVGRVFWVLSGLASAYVVLVLLSLVVPAGLSRPTVPGLAVPGPGVPHLRDAQGARHTVSQLLKPAPSRSTPPGHGPSALRTTSATATVQTATPAAPPPSAGPSPRPTSLPSTGPTARPTSAPTHRSTNAPSPKPHPTHTGKP